MSFNPSWNITCSKLLRTLEHCVRTGNVPSLIFCHSSPFFGNALPLPWNRDKQTFFLFNYKKKPFTFFNNRCGRIHTSELRVGVCALLVENLGTSMEKKMNIFWKIERCRNGQTVESEQGFPHILTSNFSKCPENIFFYILGSILTPCSNFHFMKWIFPRHISFFSISQTFSPTKRQRCHWLSTNLEVASVSFSNNKKEKSIFYMHSPWDKSLLPY